MVSKTREGNPGKRPPPPPPIRVIDETNYKDRIKQKIDYLDKHIDNYYKSDCITAICMELISEKDALEYLMTDLSIKNTMIELMLDKIQMTKPTYRESDNEYANGQVYMNKGEIREHIYKLAKSIHNKFGG